MFGSCSRFLFLSSTLIWGCRPHLSRGVEPASGAAAHRAVVDRDPAGARGVQLLDFTSGELQMLLQAGYVFVQVRDRADECAEMAVAPCVDEGTRHKSIGGDRGDRKSTRLNSSHRCIS